MGGLVPRNAQRLQRTQPPFGMEPSYSYDYDDDGDEPLTVLGVDDEDAEANNDDSGDIEGDADDGGEDMLTLRTTWAATNDDDVTNINDDIDRHHLKIWGAEKNDDPADSDDKYITDDEYTEEN